MTFMGTGGSIPVSNSSRCTYGGNTTCVRVESGCLPEGSALVIDAGTGIVPLAKTLLEEGVRNLNVLFTHYHHDHTQGLLLAATTFVASVQNTLWGASERGIGPAEVYRTLMAPPLFPISFNHRLVGSHFVFRKFDNPGSEVIAVHPQGGFKRFTARELERAENDGQMLTFGSSKYAIKEMLIIRMIKSNHPEFTISYRFEERPTGKVFVFLTDHENTDGVSGELKGHLKGADLLVMDSQYDRERYDRATAGFGHGTADYCVRIAILVGAKRLGLTHHDPMSTDKDIDAIFAEATAALETLTPAGSLPTIEVQALRDYDIATV